MTAVTTSGQFASFRTLAIAVFLVTLLLIAGASAKPIPITGPTVITSPGQYYIAAGVTNSTAPVYIEVQASNVYIDGKGKVIDGSDSANSIGIKIYNSAMSLVNVVVKNVVLNDWGTGLWLNDVKNSLIDKVTVTSCPGNGVLLQNSIGNTIQNSVLEKNEMSGIILYSGSNSNTVQGVTSQDNMIDGIRIRFSNNNIVQNSKLLNNRGDGLNFNEQAHYNTVIKNTITGNNGHGIELYESGNNQITQNTIRDNKNGIYVNSNCFNNEISKNTLSGNDFNGLVLLHSATDNVVFGNIVDTNGEAGLWLFDNNHNVLYDNKIRNNVNEGLWIRDSAENVFFNNYFYNTNNTRFITPSKNTWNLTVSEQKSITGGKYSGGNSWGQPDGQGFSQITPESNLNGICDGRFVMAANNIDRVPLKYKIV